MASVSPFSTFRLEDFPTQREWIDTLFLPLNTVLTQVTAALNGQTTYGENIPAMTRVIAGSSLTLPQSFQVAEGVQPTQMIIAQAVKNGSPITMVGAWSIDGDTITVNQLFEISASGIIPLTSGEKYSITLRFT